MVITSIRDDEIILEREKKKKNNDRKEQRSDASYSESVRAK